MHEVSRRYCKPSWVSLSTVSDVSVRKQLCCVATHVLVGKTDQNSEKTMNKVIASCSKHSGAQHAKWRATGPRECQRWD